MDSSGGTLDLTGVAAESGNAVDVVRLLLYKASQSDVI